MIRKIEQGEFIAYITTFTLHSIEVILDRNKKREGLKNFLQRIEESQAWTIYPTSTREEREALTYAEQFSLDFDDALHYYVAKTLNLTLVSFDRDFDKTDTIRIEPSGYD